MDTELTQTATHEARHAVCAWMLGRRIDHIEVERDGSRGNCRLEPVFAVNEEGRPTGITRAQALTEVVIRLIGDLDRRPPVRLQAWPPGFGADDLTASQVFADAAASSAKESDAILAEGRARATELAEPPDFRRLVDALAASLARWPHWVSGEFAEGLLTDRAAFASREEEMSLKNFAGFTLLTCEEQPPKAALGERPPAPRREHRRGRATRQFAESTKSTKISEIGAKF